jgi:hypothetical protein
MLEGSLLEPCVAAPLQRSILVRVVIMPATILTPQEFTWEGDLGSAHQSTSSSKLGEARAVIG